MPATDAQLRAQVFDLARGRCEWPECDTRAEELAHLHSKGMGGRGSAQSVSNVMAACFDHARISDGEFGSGGRRQYEAAHVLLDVGEGPGRAWHRAEALTAHLAEVRLR